MKKLLIVAVALCGALVANSASAGNGTPINTGSANTLTLAVYGDWPYSPLLLNAAPLLLDSINSDPKVRLVMHLGDIHSGSMLCTLQWNLQIYDVFQQFKDPLVYTPGDNEWTDCHRPAEGNKDPLVELANIRGLFFPTPGYTLGGRKKQVLSQAQVVDMFHPDDAQFVENVMSEPSRCSSPFRRICGTRPRSRRPTLGTGSARTSRSCRSWRSCPSSSSGRC